MIRDLNYELYSKEWDKVKIFILETPVKSEEIC